MGTCRHTCTLSLVHLLKTMSEWNLGVCSRVGGWGPGGGGSRGGGGLWGAEVGGFGVVGLE